MKILPWLILAAGVGGLYWLWKKLAAGSPAAMDAAAARAAWLVTWHAACDGQAAACQSNVAVARQHGANSGAGGWVSAVEGSQNPDGTPECGTCNVPVVLQSGADYGGCPDRLSCSGEPQGGYAGAPYTPTMPSTGPLTATTPVRVISQFGL